MSIILRALRKVQNQKEEPSPAVSAEKTAEQLATGKDRTPPSSSPVLEEDTSRYDEMSDLPADFHGDQAEPVAGLPEMAHHRFGLAPKALLGLLLVLAIFTTGWFASKIYLNLNSGVTGTKADSSSGSEQASEPMRTARAALPAAEPEPPAELPQTQQPEPTGAATGNKPLRTEPAEPAAEEAPALMHADAPRNVAQPQPVAIGTQPVEPALQSSAPVVEEESLSTTVPTAEPEIPEPDPPLPVAKEESRETIFGKSEPSPPVEKEPLPAKKGRPELKINAIAWRAKEPRAIVNMQRVRVGDVIEGAKVLAIKKKIIFFEYEGEFFEVRF